MNWLKSFINKNKKLTVALGAALLVSIGVPVYIATPLSNEAVEQISTHLNKEEQEDLKGETDETFEEDQQATE